VVDSLPLGDDHDLTGFRCGNAELDRWLVEFARTAEAKRVSRTFVWTLRGEVIGYYSISAHLLQRDDLPAKLGRCNPSQIPAVLLGRLALHERLRGQHRGGELLADALSRILDATDTVAARFVVVDAIDENAVGFYLHHGFRPIPDTMRLVQKLSDIAAALHPH
jgi:predicted GNAT family N-acyltransferase